MQEEFEPINLTEPEEKQDTKGKRVIIAITCVLLVVILAVATALLLKTYVISSFIVDGISMYPTLDGGKGEIKEGSSEEERTNGEKIYLNKVAKIKRGDIVVFTPQWVKNASGKYITLVKRVIAVAGDHVVIKDDKVWINDELLEEDYINKQDYCDSYDIDVYVPDGHIYCLGDNRNHSDDSRKFGAVNLDCVIGKGFLVKGIDGKLRSI